MLPQRSLYWLALCLSLSQLGCAGDPPPYKLETVQGAVISYQKEQLTIQPADTKSKPVVLKVTGTSRFTLAGTQTREKQLHMTQREIEPKGLEEKQPITAIYAVVKTEKGDQGDAVLLSAIAVPN